MCICACFQLLSVSVRLHLVCWLPWPAARQKSNLLFPADSHSDLSCGPGWETPARGRAGERATGAGIPRAREDFWLHPVTLPRFRPKKPPASTTAAADDTAVGRSGMRALPRGAETSLEGQCSLLLIHEVLRTADCPRSGCLFNYRRQARKVKCRLGGNALAVSTLQSHAFPYDLH